MQILVRKGDIATEFFSFIEEVGQRLRHGESSGIKASPLLDAHPGLRELFLSFTAASETPRAVADRRLEEWNPLSQRVLLSDERRVAASALETEFSLVSMHAQTFVEWAHEAVHILALEPWFAGTRAIASEDDFLAWYLAGEAFAFWYADVVVIRAIRATVPEAELVYTRSSVSNTGFHPEQAFRMLGLNEASAMLPVYVAAFLGDVGSFSQSDNPLCAIYGRRIREFYRNSIVTLKTLYGLLAGLGIIGEFARRFCLKEGLPSLLDEPSSAATSPLSIGDFIVALGRNFLPGMAGLPQERLDRVAARRHAQTRAYFAWLLRWCLRNGWVLQNGSLDQAAIESRTDCYLDALEAALLALSEGECPTETHKRIRAADDFYESEIRTAFRASNAHARYRYWVFPYFEPTGGLIGIWDGRTDYNLDEAEAVLRQIFQRSAWSPQLIERLAEFLRLKRANLVEEARRCFNDFLQHPDALPNWSIAFEDIAPRHSLFREIVFEFH